MRIAVSLLILQGIQNEKASEAHKPDKPRIEISFTKCNLYREFLAPVLNIEKSLNFNFHVGCDARSGVVALSVLSIIGGSVALLFALLGSIVGFSSISLLYPSFIAYISKSDISQETYAENDLRGITHSPWNTQYEMSVSLCTWLLDMLSLDIKHLAIIVQVHLRTCSARLFFS